MAGSSAASPLRGRGMRLALAWGLAWTFAGTSMLAPRPLLAEPSGSKTQPVAEQSPQPDPRDEQIERAMAAYPRGTQSYELAQHEVARADFTEAARLEQPRERERKAEEDERAARTKAADDAAQPQPPVEPTIDEPPPRRDAGRPLLIAGAALALVGAAVALGGGITLGVLAQKRSTAVDDVQKKGNPDELTFAQTQALEREGKRLEGIQIGLVAGGAVVAVTGAVLLALGLRKRQAVGAQAWRVGPLYAGGSSTAGLVLTGRF